MAAGPAGAGVEQDLAAVLVDLADELRVGFLGLPQRRGLRAPEQAEDLDTPARGAAEHVTDRRSRAIEQFVQVAAEVQEVDLIARLGRVQLGVQPGEVAAPVHQWLHPVPDREGAQVSGPVGAVAVAQEPRHEGRVVDRMAGGILFERVVSRVGGAWEHVRIVPSRACAQNRFTAPGPAAGPARSVRPSIGMVKKSHQAHAYRPRCPRSRGRGFIMDRMGLPSHYAHYSRRAFFGVAAAVMAAGAAACDAAARTVGRSGSPGKIQDQAVRAKARGPVAENDLPGDPHWNIRHLGAPDAIVGYAGQASVLPGEPITLYVSTTARSFRVSAFRMGWYKGDEARLLWKSATVKGHRQRQPDLIQPTNTVEARWGPSLTVPTHDWPEGSYLLRLDTENGAQRFVPVTVRSASTAGKTVIKNGTETWQAYNTWGGYDLYNGPGGVGDYDNRSLAVSLDRPYDANGAYMFCYHERKTIELAERAGLPLAYITSMDLDADPHLLDGAHAVFTGGHDEYWTPHERAHLTAARNAGVNIAFMGANTMFRRTRMASTRLGERRLVICYKTSYLQDPMYGKNNALVTSDWREPPVPDPESSLTGTLYESNPVTADFVVASPDSWIFAGTGVGKGTKLTGLVGIEYDRVNPVYPVQRPIQVLSHSPLQCRGVNSYSDSAYYTHRGGAGVFNTGTMRWVACSNGLRLFGLNKQAHQFTRQVTTNLLRGFADGPAAGKYPAHDNLGSMQEWPGDPIAGQHNLWPPVVL